jgi:hypothetical protein
MSIHYDEKEKFFTPVVIIEPKEVARMEGTTIVLTDINNFELPDYN